MSNTCGFNRSRWLNVLLISFAASWMVAASDSVISVKVRPGDTVSYLAFKHCFAYNQDIIDKIKQLNPHIEDLDCIQIGQTVHLPKPDLLSEGIASEPSPVTRRMVAATSRAVATLVEGQVQVMAPADDSWRSLDSNAILRTGDRARALDEGRLELVLDERSVLRLAANTTLELKEVEYRPEKENYRFRFRSWRSKKRGMGPLE